MSEPSDARRGQPAGAHGELAGKVALVTGGSSGIGRATALLLARRGARVALCGVDRADVEHTVEQARRTQPDAAEVVGDEVDVTDEDAVGDWIERAANHFDGVDILTTAAGVQRYGTGASTSAAEWDEVLRINLTGAFLAIHHALPHLRRRGGGSIVLVSSVQAFAPQTNVVAYSTGKSALNGLARSVAVDEARHNIRANAVCPGSVDTPMLRGAARRFSDGSDAGADAVLADWGRMHPLGRVARADEVAEAIAFLAGDRASFITGTALPVDGGLLATAGVALPV